MYVLHDKLCKSVIKSKKVSRLDGSRVISART